MRIKKKKREKIKKKQTEFDEERETDGERKEKNKDKEKGGMRETVREGREGKMVLPVVVLRTLTHAGGALGIGHTLTTTCARLAHLWGQQQTSQ